MAASAKSSKSADAFRTISEAAKELDVPQHVLRHWEEVFGQVRPMRRAGGRRYYRPLDIDLLRGIRVLLYDQRYTTKGVQRIFKDEGVKYVSELGRRAAAGDAIDVRPVIEEGAPNGAAKSSLEDDVLELGAEVRIDSPAQRSAALDQGALASVIARLEAAQKALDETAEALLDIEAKAQDH